MDTSKQILCIEDDTFLLNLISSMFAHAGISAVGAHTGDEGLSLAKSVQPSLILLDLMLPDCPGLEVLEKLKGEQATAHIPVLIFSNLGDRSDVEKSIALGAQSYLVKSNTLPGELVQIVAKLLGIEEGRG